MSLHLSINLSLNHQDSYSSSAGAGSSSHTHSHSQAPRSASMPMSLEEDSLPSLEKLIAQKQALTVKIDRLQSSHQITVNMFQESIHKLKSILKSKIPEAEVKTIINAYQAELTALSAKVAILNEPSNPKEQNILNQMNHRMDALGKGIDEGWKTLGIIYETNELISKEKALLKHAKAEFSRTITAMNNELASICQKIDGHPSKQTVQQTAEKITVVLEASPQLSEQEKSGVSVTLCPGIFVQAEDLSSKQSDEGELKEKSEKTVKTAKKTEKTVKVKKRPLAEPAALEGASAGEKASPVKKRKITKLIKTGKKVEKEKATGTKEKAKAKDKEKAKDKMDESEVKIKKEIVEPDTELDKSKKDGKAEKSSEAEVKVKAEKNVKVKADKRGYYPKDALVSYDKVPSLPPKGAFAASQIHSLIYQSKSEELAKYLKSLKESELAAVLNSEVAGFTPIQLAMLAGTVKKVKVLLKYKPDLFCFVDGWNLMHLLAMSSKMNDHGVSDILSHLIENGFTLESFTQMDKPPIHLAAYNDNDITLKAMLDTREGIRMINSGDARGCGPIHLACLSKDNLRALKVLLSYNAKLNLDLCDGSGQTALSYACDMGFYVEGEEGIVTILVEAGANPDIKDKKKKTCLDYCTNPSDQGLEAAARDSQTRKTLRHYLRDKLGTEADFWKQAPRPAKKAAKDKA